ncbi:MAG: MFS transporter [Peptococcaceae bacterium]|nr:MFS transporter [Peptococcaceae bacterium]
MTKQSRGRSFMASILSLSLLTVMAGAAVAPALGVIQAYFADSNQLFVQMIVSIPAIFIVITNFFFPKLCKSFGAKTLVTIGLIFYVFGGCLAGAFSNIFLVLLTRAFVGIGVGIIMPLSTGLLAYYFAPGEQEQLMGYSSAMNQMGGVIATLLSGLLAGISWRASFLVYLMGLISMVLCLIFLPNDNIGGGEEQESSMKTSDVLKQNYRYVGAMFLLMTTFFVYPTNFAMETVKEGLIPQQYIAVIMAGMDFVAFFGGMLFVKVKSTFGRNTRFVAPLLFLIGYMLLAIVGGWPGVLAGSVCIGFANGAGIPYIISEASMRVGRSAAVTVMPLISAALYLAQFLCPFFVSMATVLAGSVMHLPYWFGIVMAALFCAWSAKMR